MRPSTAVSAGGPGNLLSAVRAATSPQARGKGVLVVLNDEIAAARDATKTNTYRVETFNPANSASSDTWMGTASASTAPPSGATPPPVGRPPLFLGHVELMAGGKYRVSRTSGGPYFGEGTYRYNAGATVIEWLTGPDAEPDWGGKFPVEDGRHRIAPRAGTIATNSPGQ